MALKPQVTTEGDLVQKHINTAYDIVRSVALQLENIAIIADDDNLAEIIKVGADILNVDIVAADITAGKIDAAIAAAISTALDVIATNADVVITNGDVVSTNADVVTTNADVVTTNADAASTAADVISVASILDQFQDNYLGAYATDPTLDNDGDPLVAGTLYWNTTDSEVRFYNGTAWESPEAAASTSATAALAAQVAAELALDSFDDRYLGAKTTNPTLDNDGEALIVGALYWNSVVNNLRVYDGAAWQNINTATINDTATVDPTITDDSSLNYTPGSHWVNVSTQEYFICFDNSIGAAIWEKVSTQAENANLPARNTILTANALSQAGSAEGGFSATIYTGNGTSQSIATGIDMATGDYGGLVWVKSRGLIASHMLFDTIRGEGTYLRSHITNAEATVLETLSSFNTTGFSVGSDVTVNTNTDDLVAWSFQTNKKKTGTTNRNKAYTAHYNANLGFSIVGYEGDGADGHEIPHHLGVVPELSIFKDRDTVQQWAIQSSLFDLGDYLYFTTAALANSPSLDTIFSDTTLALADSVAYNAASKNHIMYNFHSVSGVCKIDKYIGTGAAGNYVECGFKPGFVMVKNLTDVGNWVIVDEIRGDEFLYPNTSGAQAVTTLIDFDDNGFFIDNNSSDINNLNEEHIFIAFKESSIDATKAVTDYTLPTNADQLANSQSLITFANGFNANGQVDAQEQVAAGTLTFGAGYEDKKLYIYRDKDTAWGYSEDRPLTGLTRPDADKYGGEYGLSPIDALALHANSRTTAKHFDYESESGVALASGEFSADQGAWKAFNKLNAVQTAITPFWQIDSTTNSWVQYKHTEKRILKSWRMSSRLTDGVTRSPRRFTIEGSNDGLNWTAIDSTYTASDYVPTGLGLWGDLHSTSANTTAYLYHRINITANNGNVTYTAIEELEFNTIIESDYYLIDEGKIFNNAGTRLDRVYVGEVITDASGNVSHYTNYAAGKLQLNEVEVHGKAVFHDEVLGRMFATAWVTFDGTQNPPLILDSENVKDIVDLGTGNYKIIFGNPMDNNAYSIISTAIQTNGSSLIRSFGIDTTSPITRQGFNIINAIGSATASTTMTDTVRGNIIVFGGKEIK
jgi:hypothetical protein